MLFTAGHHGKSCWLVFFFQSRVLPYVDLLWHPLNHLKVIQTKLTMVASAPAIDLMVDVNRLYAITSIFCILSFPCDLMVLLLSICFICSCSMINFCLFSNAYGVISSCCHEYDVIELGFLNLSGRICCQSSSLTSLTSWISCILD